MEPQLHFQLQNLGQDVLSRWFLIVGPTLHFLLSHECFFFKRAPRKLHLCQRFNVVLNQLWFWRFPIWEWEYRPLVLWQWVMVCRQIPQQCDVAFPAFLLIYFGDSTGATAIFFYQIRVIFCSSSIMTIPLFLGRSLKYINACRSTKNLFSSIIIYIKLPYIWTYLPSWLSHYIWTYNDIYDIWYYPNI